MTNEDLDLSTGPSLKSAATIVIEHDSLEVQQQKLQALGVPLCPDGQVGYETVKAIDALLCDKKRFVYTQDQDLPFNEKLGIKTRRYEVWRAFYEDFLDGKPVFDDCDGEGLLALQLACIAGVPKTRLAQGLVVSETAWKILNKPVSDSSIDHFIGMYYYRGRWLTFGDTWGQEVKPSMVPANDRHRVRFMSIVDEGILWRRFKE